MRSLLLMTMCLLRIAGPASAGVPTFSEHTVEAPTGAAPGFDIYWADIEGDGLKDLFILPRGQEQVLLFRQTPSGFAAAPSQVVKFPEGTAWFGVWNLDGAPGSELLFSGPGGLRFYPQVNGSFTQDAKVLLDGDQVFTGKSSLKALPLGQAGSGRILVPMIRADRVRFYEVDDSRKLRLTEEARLDLWHSVTDARVNQWSAGQNASHAIVVETVARGPTATDRQGSPTAENPSIEAMQRRMRETSGFIRSRVETCDINRDGRQDLVLWSLFGGLEPKTRIAVFLRQADGSLPSQPSYAIRYPGAPVRLSAVRDSVSVLADVDGDGRPEIVLATPKPLALSITALMEMYMNKGLEFTVAIWRYDDRNGFSGQPDFGLPVTTKLPLSSLGGDLVSVSLGTYEWLRSLIAVEGDFNGDGRPDCVVARLPTLIQIYCSTAGRGFFPEKPSLEVRPAVEGEITLDDLNGDGLSDLCVSSQEEQRISLFLSGVLQNGD